MKKQRPELFFSLLILILGSVLLLITPAGANFDEETYVARIWETALGHVMPNSYLGGPERFPSGFFDISYRRNINLPAIDINTIENQLKLNINDIDLMTYQTRAFYFPTLFIVQAAVMRFFGPHLHLPILIIYYLLRFSYLILYSLLIYLTIKILPFGKWVFGALAIAPMCMIQAAAISSDSLIFGISFLFIAWIIRLASIQKDELTKKELIITCLLILSLGTLKPNAIFLLPLLLVISPKYYKNIKIWLPILFATLISLLLSVGWSVVGPSYLTSKDSTGIDAMAQVITLLTHPQQFLTSFWNMISSSVPVYYRQMVGVAGYGYWNMPNIIYWLFPISLLLALLTEQSEVSLSIKQRIWFGLVGLFNIFMIFVVFYIVITPVGSTRIEGVQGRYFESFLPLLLVPFMFKPKFHLNRLIIGTLLTFSSIVCVVSLFLSYNVVCGYAMATNQPCVLPYYKNWDPSTFLSVTLDKDTEITQSEVITCKQLTGFRVWVNKNESLPGQREFFTLETIDGIELRSSWIEADKMPQNGWAAIEFTPPLNSLNSEFQFKITPKNGTGIPGLELGRFPTSEFLRGSLWINGIDTEDDLVFKYTCADDLSTLTK